MDSQVDMDYPFCLRLLVGIIVALWASDIGPEIIGIPLEPSAKVVNQNLAVSSTGKKIQLEKLGDNIVPSLDREAFLASYKRQARASLNECLQGWMPSPGRATFVAVLTKKTGQLTNLEVLGGSNDMPSCVVSLTFAMDFSSVVETMTGGVVTLQWNADW